MFLRHGCLRKSLIVRIRVIQYVVLTNTHTVGEAEFWSCCADTFIFVASFCVAVFRLKFKFVAARRSLLLLMIIVFKL